MSNRWTEEELRKVGEINERSKIKIHCGYTRKNENGNEVLIDAKTGKIVHENK